MSPSSLGTRGNVPEATSVVLFGLVAVLLWFAMLHGGRDALAAEREPPNASPVASPSELGASVTTPAVERSRE